MSLEVDTTAGPGPPSTAAGPLPPEERVIFIDALRGVALCGVLLANLPWWTGDTFMTPTERAAFSTAPVDAVVRGFLRVMVDNKFIGLFSLLFGLGVALQIERGRAAGRSALRSYLRRLIVLLAIGLIHGYLLWFGDILRFYALWGLALALFHRCSNRALLTWGLVLGVVVPGVWRGVVILFGHPSPAENGDLAELEIQTLRAFASGSYREMLRWNWAYDWSETLASTAGAIFGRFLLGLWMGRTRLLLEPQAQQSLLRRVACWGLGLGLAGNVLFAVLVAQEDRDLRSESDGWMAAMPLLIEIGFLGLTAFYACGLALLYASPQWRRRLERLAPVGRMALTNYLMQTAIGLWLFYGFAPGPHLMGRVGLSFIVPVWITVFALQVWLSRWWLDRFRFGPMEWLWRSLTYGRSATAVRIHPPK